MSKNPELISARLLILLAFALAIRHWVWSPVLVSGESMCPTLRNGQLASVNKLVYLFNKPHRGDIVLFWTGGERMAKRIIGLPGEKVEAREGMFYINGEVLAERYLKLSDLAPVHPGRLAPDCFLVAGDNRSQTIVAIVHKTRILGRLQPCSANGSLGGH